uniref:Pentraxin (PTX) domain-containing protein n=1 Tax=Stegastes partitus TaxID=144197 RepID=A0A3B4ZUF4_9TELE
IKITTLKFISSESLWQLQPDVVVPALRELTVCTLLRRTSGTDWTGFVYKAPEGRKTELGLVGTNTNVTVRLFGLDFHFPKELTVDEWYSVCLTWSCQTRWLRVYVNETGLGEEQLNATTARELARNGTLTLGVSHYVTRNGVKPESNTNLVGDIDLFRMWGREWSAEELRELSCADGDVLSWDLRHLKHDNCAANCKDSCTYIRCV